MKLWDKGFSIDKQIEKFTVGNDREIDMHIAKYDVQASLAHAIMLESIGIITSNELKDLKRGLQELADDIKNALDRLGAEDFKAELDSMKPYVDQYFEDKALNALVTAKMHTKDDKLLIEIDDRLKIINKI